MNLYERHESYSTNHPIPVLPYIILIAQPLFTTFLWFLCKQVSTDSGKILHRSSQNIWGSPESLLHFQLLSVSNACSPCLLSFSFHSYYFEHLLVFIQLFAQLHWNQLFLFSMNLWLVWVFISLYFSHVSFGSRFVMIHPFYCSISSKNSFPVTMYMCASIRSREIPIEIISSPPCDLGLEVCTSCGGQGLDRSESHVQL